ncbi:MAG: hypothetical protein CMJ34_06650 [Phycisphaerae bacterium]|nr:hypothetical protein [Phycisphaerae bacterium]
MHAVNRDAVFGKFLNWYWLVERVGQLDCDSHTMFRFCCDVRQVNLTVHTSDTAGSSARVSITSIIKIDRGLGFMKEDNRSLRKERLSFKPQNAFKWSHARRGGVLPQRHPSKGRNHFIGRVPSGGTIPFWKQRQTRLLRELRVLRSFFRKNWGNVIEPGEEGAERVGWIGVEPVVVSVRKDVGSQSS